LIARFTEPQEPGDERDAPVFEARNRFKGLEERLRGEVFGECEIAWEDVRVTEDAE
jgi:hypothetical protein